MKFTLIQRKESGPWYLRVRLNGLDQKINLGTDSKQKANKLAPAKYDEFVRTATVDGDRVTQTGPMLSLVWTG